VQIGDEVVIHDHVAIPVDGEVVEGEAVVNQSAITGENLPVSVGVGTPVHAGSVVERGRLVVARPRRRQPNHHRPHHRQSRRGTTRSGTDPDGRRELLRRFVPTSFILSGLTLLVTGDVRRAMTMLLVACPCAVGLSTPTAISAAIGNARAAAS